MWNQKNSERHFNLRFDSRLALRYVTPGISDEHALLLSFMMTALKVATSRTFIAPMMNRMLDTYCNDLIESFTLLWLASRKGKTSLSIV